MGKKRSDETKQKISIATTGDKNPMFGKISKSKGKKCLKNFAEKNSEARKGRFLLGENSNAKKSCRFKNKYCL